MFVSTYGFSRGTLNKPNKWARMVQKAICTEKGAEIYQIGHVSMEGRQTDVIYVLEYGDKVIPFIQRPLVPITHKQKSLYHGTPGAIFSNIPVCSVIVADIGKDLGKLPRGRDHNAFYDRHCFQHEDHQYHAFEDEDEYQEVVALIEEGLPVLLGDRYQNHLYEPVLPAEIISAIGPWNFHDDLYRKENEERRRHYESEYIACHHIDWQLDKAKQSDKDDQIQDLKEKAKKFPFLKEANKTRFAMHKKSHNTAKSWLKEFKKKIKTLDEFMEFLAVHPVLRDPTKGMVNLGDIMQDVENREVFFIHLVQSNHPILKDFEAYKQDLEQKAINYVETKYINPFSGQTIEYKEILETFENLEKEERDLSIEVLLSHFLKMEPPFHAEYGAMLNTNILKEQAFLNLLRQSYNAHYTSVLPNFEAFLVMVVQVLDARVNDRNSRQRCDRGYNTSAAI